MFSSKLFSATALALFTASTVLPSNAQAYDAQLEVENQTRRTVNIFWLNRGLEEFGGQILAGESGTTQTYFGHAFVYRDAQTNAVLGQVTVNSRFQNYQVRSNTAQDEHNVQPPQGDRLKKRLRKFLEGLLGEDDDPQPEPQPPIVGGYEQQVLNLVNKERQKHGLQPVKLDSKLNAASLDHSKDMQARNFFSHQSPIAGKRDFWQRAQNFGTTANSENIAMGQQTPQKVVEGWMNSSGHRRNILSPRATRMGIGRVGNYWTQMFGS